MIDELKWEDFFCGPLTQPSHIFIRFYRSRKHEFYNHLFVPVWHDVSFNSLYSPWRLFICCEPRVFLVWFVQSSLKWRKIICSFTSNSWGSGNFELLWNFFMLNVQQHWKCCCTEICYRYNGSSCEVYLDRVHHWWHLSSRRSIEETTRFPVNVCRIVCWDHQFDVWVTFQ